MSIPEPPQPTLRLRLDQDALASNWRSMDRLSGAARAGAAIKANCYGLGIDRCLPILRDAGAEQFFVAHWGEVAAAARHVPADQIAVLHGPMNEAEVRFAMASGAIPVINSLDQAHRWNAANGSTCHVMVDTGINRLGVSPEEISDPAIAALQVHTLLSHLASADEDSTLNARQLERFHQSRSHVAHQQASLANSAGVGLGEDYAFDLTRPGLALYGGVPREDMTPHIQQVAYLEAAVIQTRTLQAGDGVGYNSAFKADRAMPVATVSLGYADGFLRAWGGGAVFEYHGTKLPVLGKVSMDMVVVDCTAAPDLREGDWIHIPYNLPVAARQTAVSQYELLTVLGQRFGC